LDLAKASYATLIKFNASTQYKKDVDEKLARIEKELQQFSN